MHQLRRQVASTLQYQLSRKELASSPRNRRYQFFNLCVTAQVEEAKEDLRRRKEELELEAQQLRRQLRQVNNHDNGRLIRDRIMTHLVKQLLLRFMRECDSMIS